MTIRIAKSTGNARRQLSYVSDASLLKKGKREKSLTLGKKRISGRNHQGRIVVYRKGGYEKRLLRIVDFSGRAHMGQKAKVINIQYDPGRSAYIALIEYLESGEKSYILAPNGLKKNAEITCDEKASNKIGNRMAVKNIPLSTQIHNIEVAFEKGGQLCKSAGSYAVLLGFDGKYALIKLPSSETRKILNDNFASIGVVSNIDHSKVRIGKAGRSRHMGKQPSVRGKAKNPCDHPHGGGEGGSSIGMPYPKTPWGAPALGPRTRNKKKQNANMVISRRKK